MFLMNEQFLYYQLKKLIVITFLFSVICTVMVGLRMVFTSSNTYLYLIWNLFLAWVPLGFSLLINYIYLNKMNSNKSILVCFLGIVWISFYPNAPYIITDLIHLSRIDFYVRGHLLLDIMIWFDLLLNVLVVSTGYLVGLVSLNIIHRLLGKSFSQLVAWSAIIIILVLSGFGIYLGRFIRLNSWEIVTDSMKIIQSIINVINIQTLIFTGLFSMFMLLIYVAFYFIVDANKA